MHEQSEQTKYAWLIELVGGACPAYWDGRGDETFTYKTDDAVRFTRKEDANRVIQWVIAKRRRSHVEAREHGWVPFVGLPITPPASPPVEMGEREDAQLELVRAEIERRYERLPLGSGAVGGTFGEILCHELHQGDDERPAGLHFVALATKWDISVHLLGRLIAHHCDRLPGRPFALSPESDEQRARREAFDRLREEVRLAVFDIEWVKRAANAPMPSDMNGYAQERVLWARIVVAAHEFILAAARTQEQHG